jgi:hypothetical protein
MKFAEIVFLSGYQDFQKYIDDLNLLYIVNNTEKENT